MGMQSQAPDLPAKFLVLILCGLGFAATRVFDNILL